jgi:hypothetical protein
VQSQGVDTSRTRQGRPTGGIDFDASKAPLYVIRFAETVTDADVEEVLASMREVWKLRRKIVVLCDVSNSSLTPRQRKLVGDEMKRDRDNYARWVDAWAGAVRSTLSRHTLTALTWMSPPPFEMRIFDKLEDASSWAIQRVSELKSPR